MANSKLVENIETNKVCLEVYECTCGYHMGIDSSYLEQVDENISLECPSCGEEIIPEKTDTQEKEDSSIIIERTIQYKLPDGSSFKCKEDALLYEKEDKICALAKEELLKGIEKLPSTDQLSYSQPALKVSKIRLDAALKVIDPFFGEHTGVSIYGTSTDDLGLLTGDYRTKKASKGFNSLILALLRVAKVDNNDVYIALNPYASHSIQTGKSIIVGIFSS